MVIFTNCGLLSNKPTRGTHTFTFHGVSLGAASHFDGFDFAFAISRIRPFNARSYVDVTVKLRQSFAVGVLVSTNAVAYLRNECQCLERGFCLRLRLSFTVRADAPFKMLQSVRAT